MKGIKNMLDPEAKEIGRVCPTLNPTPLAS